MRAWRSTTLAVAVTAAAAATPAWAGGSAGTVPALRAQVVRFVNDELRDNGADACAVLNAPLSGVVGHRTCAERWNSSLRSLSPAQRRALRNDARAAATAHVTRTDRGLLAVIALPTPLLGDASRFYWTDDCWMLER